MMESKSDCDNAHDERFASNPSAREIAGNRTHCPWSPAVW